MKEKEARKIMKKLSWKQKMNLIRAVKSGVRSMKGRVKDMDMDMKMNREAYMRIAQDKATAITNKIFRENLTTENHLKAREERLKKKNGR